MAEDVLSVLPDGYSSRPVRFEGDEAHPDDVADVYRLVSALETYLTGSAESSLEETASDVAGVDVLRDHSRLVADADGQVVASSWLEKDETGRNIFVETYVQPDHPKRPELMDALLTHAVDTALGSVESSEDWSVTVGAESNEDDYIALLRTRGFEVVRRFLRMHIATGDERVPVSAPSLPDGVTIDEIASDEDRRTWHDVDQDAFSEHWDFVPRSFEEAWPYLSAHGGDQPKDWWLLRVDGEPAAVVLLTDRRASLGDGYIRVLGVRKDFRGRGLAKLLLQRAFVRARDEGRTGVSLHVDAQNATDATKVYEAVGMTRAREVAFLRRPLGGL